MKLTPIAKALSVAATRLGIAASVQPKSMAMGVVVSPIQLAYELGTFILRMSKVDSVAALDTAGAVSQVFLDFFKTQTDNAVLADAVAMDFYKALTDQAGFTDATIMDFFKALSDTASASDTVAKSFGRPVADEFSVLELAVKAFTKTLVDDAGVSDLEVFTFYKTLTDDYSVSDANTLETGKSLSDAAGFTDELARDFSKDIVDQLIATDDWDGAASVDDDQTMLFEKQLPDLFVVTELFERLVNFVREFDDAAAATDVTTFDTGKALEDAAGFTDAELRFDGTKALTDDGVVLESISKEFAPAPILDAFAAMDEVSKAPGAVKTDTASLTDTGSLRSQGYCDFSYFAEDYVGASRTF